MTKAEYKEKHRELTQEFIRVNDELSKLQCDYLYQIRDEVEKIGLTYGTEVVVKGYGKKDLCCQFNGVHINRQHYFYIEFTYTTTSWDGVNDEYPFPSDVTNIIDVNADFEFEVKGMTYNYQKFMSQYQ